MTSRSKGYRVVAPDRHLRIRAEAGLVTIRHEGRIIARSARAVWLAEGDRPEVAYLSLDDLDPSRLVRSDTSWHCRWKGDAVYFHLDLVDRTLEDAVWAYPDAPEALSALRRRAAFDAARFHVDVDVPDGTVKEPVS